MAAVDLLSKRRAGDAELTKIMRHSLLGGHPHYNGLEFKDFYVQDGPVERPYGLRWTGEAEAKGNDWYNRSNVTVLMVGPQQQTGRRPHPDTRHEWTIPVGTLTPTGQSEKHRGEVTRYATDFAYGLSQRRIGIQDNMRTLFPTYPLLENNAEASTRCLPLHDNHSLENPMAEAVQVWVIKAVPKGRILDPFDQFLMDQTGGRDSYLAEFGEHGNVVRSPYLDLMRAQEADRILAIGSV